MLPHASLRAGGGGGQERIAYTPHPKYLPLHRATTPATAAWHLQPGPALWVCSTQKPRWVGEPSRWVCRRPRFKSNRGGCTGR